MATSATALLGHTAQKPSFAKVAASSYKSKSGQDSSRESAPATQPSTDALTKVTQIKSAAIASQPAVIMPRRATIRAQPAREASGAAAPQAQTETMSANVRQQARNQSDQQAQDRPLADDSSTQASSPDASGKPPSLDGKSVASGTTNALDEKESLRPDDSASLRAVEEEDGTSLPGSNVADSRIGSDVSGSRNFPFGDQLREIAAMGSAPRGAPIGRFPPHQIAFGTAPYVSAQQLDPAHGMPMQLEAALPAGAIGQPPTPPDEKLLEALNNPRDRVWVLKLEQDLIDFVKNPRELNLDLPNCNAFYRMLAHKLADYYFLGHAVDNAIAAVKITKTQYARIPPPLSGLAGPLMSHDTAPLDLTARKIMRRGDDNADSGNNTNANSEAPSMAPSEAGGANGSESGQASAKLTREEREAKYKEARERIFGNKDGQEASDGTKADDENANSRSSSSSGKKKPKRHRNYDNDDFEARSAFNAYFPQSYGVNTYPADGNNQMYQQYGQQVQMQQQYQMMQAPMQAPHMAPSYSNGSYTSMSQDMSQQYQWQPPQYSPAMQMQYAAPQSMPYDLSADFQRMQFQSTPYMGQQMPMQMQAPTTPLMGSDGYRPSSQSFNQGWPNMSPGFPSPGQFSSSNGSPAMPSQNGFQPGATPYLYGQLPAANTSNAKGNRNQHPVPGSYNRNQFNPQSQAFVPGARPNAYPVQNPTPTMGMAPPQMNGYPQQMGYQMQMFNQMSNQMQHASPQLQSQRGFGSPNIGHSSPASNKGNNQQRASHLPQNVSSALPQTPPHAQSQTSSAGSLQSTIAKWGNASSLPPKPPPPASMQPRKFNSPGHGVPAAGRIPSGNGRS